MYLGLLGCLTKLGAKRAKLMQKFVPRSRIGIFCNESTRSTSWTLNSCFGEFCTIWVHLGPFGCLTKLGANGPNQCKSLCHEVASEFFATKPLNPPHWTLNSCFGEFHIIWVHLGPFGCLTKLDAKWAELVQKFVP